MEQRASPFSEDDRASGHALMYDVRDIANFVLAKAEDGNLPITNLALHKLLYFMHGWYLATYERPLIKNKFEAWQYGPVQRVLYEQFKSCRDRPLNGIRATFLNPTTGERFTKAPDITESDASLILLVLGKYQNYSASELIEESHAEDGPWEYVWRQAEDSIYPGMKIPDELILMHFKRLPYFATSH